MMPYSLLIINSGIPYRIMTLKNSVDYIAINFDYTQKAASCNTLHILICKQKNV